MDLTRAIVYDEETLQNCFLFGMEFLHSPQRCMWEISEYRDDRRELLEFLRWCETNKIPMIGFNNEHFDYPVAHFLYTHPNATYAEIKEFANKLINSDNKYAHTIWPRDRFAPQVDLFKINHFDNQAKTTSLKALQINMRSQTVVDMPIAHDVRLTKEEIDTKAVPYCFHDISETKKFALHCMKAIEFRIGLVETLGADAINYNDTKIGAKILEQRIGADVCYDRVDTGNGYTRKVMRQTIRRTIPLADVIFPYISFNNPEFARVLSYLKTKVLTPEDIDDPDAPVKTKGALSGVVAHVGGLDYVFGTGGMHASVKPQLVTAGDGWLIRDIDVAGLYPAIAIVNRMAPAHLGEAFTKAYAQLPVERAKHKKGTVQNASYKLAANGTYGNSGNKYSIFYDLAYTMQTTINGQLLICMLAEWLTTVPTFQAIQVNTDGITYRIHETYEPQAKEVCKRWEQFTCLVLEDADYKRMWIRDVNNYVAETTKGKLKQKGAYWHPDPLNYSESISEASPPAWHKDLGGLVIIRAAIAAMVHGVSPETFLRAHTDPFDFMLRVKVDKASKLMLGGREIQRTSRYYVARHGAPLTKISPPPPGAVIGDYKRKSKLSEYEYQAIARTLPPGTWDERIHTKNKSRYENRTLAYEAGYMVCECNDAADFRFENVNYDWYIEQVKKLTIGC